MDTPDNSAVNIDLIRGHMDTIILRTLSDGDKYGYEILSEISDKSEGLYSLKQPTLYSCLKRLEKQGLVTSYKGDLSYGAQRVYYALTDMGRQFLENDQIQWEFSRTIINNLLSDKAYDPEKAPKPFDVSSFRPLTRRQRGDANYYATIDPEKLAQEQLQQEPPVQNDSPAEEYPEYDATPVYSEGDVVPADIPAPAPAVPYEEEHNVEIVEDGYIPPVTEPAEETDEEPVDSDASAADASSDAQSFTEEMVEEEVYDIPADGYAEEAEESDLPVEEEVSPVREEPAEMQEDTHEESPAPVQQESEYVAPVEENAADGQESAPAEQPEYPAELPVEYDVSAYEYNEEAARYAADMLYGEHSELSEEPVSEETSVRPAAPIRLPDYNEVNYIESLGKLYDRSSAEEEEEEESRPNERSSSYSADPPTLNQVRESFYIQGYNLKPYTKTTNAGYYINKYFYSNRLLRDCTFIIFAIFVAELLICAIAGGIAWTRFGLAAGISLLAPIFMTIVYLIDPNRRKKADYNFKSALINCLVFCIGYMALVFILGFFVFGVRADMGSTWIKPVFIPLVFMLDAPIAVLIYTKLYSSRKYHIN